MSAKTVTVIVCSNCNKAYSEEYKHTDCKACGYIILEQLKIRIDTINECKKCGKEIIEGLRFCDECKAEHYRHKQRKSVHV